MGRTTPHKRWLSRRDRWILGITGPMVIASFAGFWFANVREAFRREALVRLTSDAEVAIDNAVRDVVMIHDAAQAYIEPDTSTWEGEQTTAVTAISHAAEDVRAVLGGRPVAMAW